MTPDNEPDDDGIDMQMLAGLFDAPAYVRRARDEWLSMARLRVGLLHALAGDWQAVRPWLADDEQLGVLEQLHKELSPKLRLPPEPTRSPRALRRALQELIESLQRFNARW